ncbi:N-acetyltransferase family protein [Roseococcus sp. SYP-B2431]|uniref:GNAT family N-acetyltransferase n=1 Tax=Roseococcus sp. SYP-B2431 TaxID=2496640 RepID=UPI00103FD98F|nr:GNAT family N-acetyltransferase [Roseococcus sp. SYP-B2431]TCI00360.1 N-acetyltransferase family protein [Roseococcus sp. SYP-B2431]
MQIRDSVESDVPALTTIYAHWVTHGRASFELSAPGEEEMARRRIAVREGGYPHLVAEHEGEILGYSYAAAYRPRPAYRFTVENSVYIRPGGVRRGAGKALLEALIERCTALDFRLMVAVIGDSANAPSIALHAAAGFRHVGVIPGTGWKHEQWLDTVLMVRELGPGRTAPPSR